MKLKERGRYTVINPDHKYERATEKGDDANEYTDGFYSSDSDTFAPGEEGGGQESLLASANEATLSVN